MRTKGKIHLFLALVYTFILANCHDQLTFLQEEQQSIESNNFTKINSDLISSSKTQNLKAAGVIPDYDMYVLSIQWGSKKSFFSIFINYKLIKVKLIFKFSIKNSTKLKF